MPDTLGQVLIVEDDAKLATLVADFLRSNGFSVAIEPRGDDAITRIPAEQPDVVVLDLMLPGADGLSVCRSVRPVFDGGILMLTARGDEIDEIIGLEVGADDYMSKPVRPRVLLARIKSLMRRAAQPTGSVPRRLELGRLLLDAGNRSAHYDLQAIELSAAEFDLLWYLGERAGTVIDRDQLYQDVRGIRWDGVDRSIDLRISRLRRKLGSDGARVIKSVRGAGYLLVADP